MSSNFRSQQSNVNNPPAYTPNPSNSTDGYRQLNMICPPGLEYLIPLDKLFLSQQVETFEVALGMHFANSYTVVDVRGQPLYVIREKSGWLMRACAASSRRFKMSVYDCQGREALLIKRPISFIADIVDVFNGETLLGSIEKVIFSWRPQYRVYDEHRREICKIKGPLVMCGWDFDFMIFANNGTEIGVIRKQWSGALRELFTNADIFGLTFPLDLSVKAKSLLLAAAILVDFGYFEG